MIRLGARELVVAGGTKGVALVGRRLAHAERILGGRWRSHLGEAVVVIEGGSRVRDRGDSGRGVGGEGVSGGGGGRSGILDGALRRRGKGGAVSRVRRRLRSRKRVMRRWWLRQIQRCHSTVSCNSLTRQVQRQSNCTMLVLSQVATCSDVAELCRTAQLCDGMRCDATRNEAMRGISPKIKLSDRW